ncbi:Alpha/Beta hydrolase protein [Flammula alnicola]|nr:Alpha/Beta hydrolase protein [Flammula alnicola]
MSTLNVGKGISFHYRDSGPVESADYTTLVIVHGHTFHSGIFKRLLPLARAHSLRLICVSRREYEGSTPYSAEELKVINHGSDEERARWLQNQGVLLALFVDGLIQKLSLTQAGGVAMAGWSMGNIFSLAFLASIDILPEEVKERLKAYVRVFILWDPPAQVLGADIPEGSYVPLWDEELPPEARSPTFVKWCASYFTHGDTASRDFSVLNHRTPDADKKATIETMTHEELFSVADFGPGDKCDTILAEPVFGKVHADQVQKALFDKAIRESWGGLKIWHMYGEANSWPGIYSAWVLEKMVTSQLDVSFKPIEGANHFLMWDEPEKALIVLKECVAL